MLVVGLLLIAEVLVTLIWQEPFTALYAHGRQAQASRELQALDRAQLPASASAQLAQLKGSDARMAFLAQRLRQQTPGGHALGRIEIPHIGISFTFVQNTDESSLSKGPGHYADTVLPGEHGTVAIAGHRTTYLAPFRHIDSLRSGDRVLLNMPYGQFVYRVESSRVVLPSDVAVIRREQHDRVVLTACTPLFSAAKRIVVSARLESSTPRGAAIARR